MPPRPLQLNNHTRTYSSDYNYHAGQSLTPRTPRRADSDYPPHDAESHEAGYEVDSLVVPVGGHRDAGFVAHQREPLLASSASASFPQAQLRRSSIDEEGGKHGRKSQQELHFALILQRAPLVLGITSAVFLLFLIVVSLKRPEYLQWVIGDTWNESAIATTAQAPAPTPQTSAALDDSASLMAHKHMLSYENYTSFPLTPAQYLHECNKWHAGMGRMIGGYWYVPPEGAMDVMHHDEAGSPSKHLPEGEAKRVCSSTITYMLDGYVGLAADLALMAQAAGLAREQNRTFFVNDQYWNRGKWTDHFQDVRQRQPGPEPGCLAPPPEELVACPRVARHWVMNSRTAKFHLGHMFDNEFEDPYAQSLRRLKPIYERAALSLRHTIRPNAQNAELIRAAREELAAALPPLPRQVSDQLLDTDVATDSDTTPSAGDHDHDFRGRDPGSYVAVHIRRGDRKAEAWPHVGKYIPLAEYVAAVRDTWARLANRSSVADPEGEIAVWVASDDPQTVRDFEDLLAYEESLRPGDGAVAQGIDSGAPAPRLFSLARSGEARLREVASPRAYFQAEFAQLPLEERINWTHGAVVDLAMASGAWVWENEARPFGTVCTLGSNICKLAAVGFGWERAFGFGPLYIEDGSSDADAKSDGSRKGTHSTTYPQNEIDDARKRWVEIDDKGNIEPVWRAFEMF